ncbi:MAG: hypothetical protein EBS42_08610 [Caulobacteraceae bacterium]|nr:hypothetical protein [Caulobacteraceae bacterium]
MAMSPDLARPLSLGQVERKAQRNRCFLAATVVYGPHDIVVPATVRDISECGARLTLPPFTPLPPTFRVLMKQSGKCHNARMAWRRGEVMAVEFLSDVDMTTQQDESVRLLRRLALEMAGRSQGD